MITVPEVLQEMIDLYKRKNQNYGNSVDQVPVLAPNITPRDALLVRMSDKIQRMQTLVKGEKDKVGESLLDTMRDLAVYIAIFIAQNRNWEEKCNQFEAIRKAHEE